MTDATRNLLIALAAAAAYVLLTIVAPALPPNG